MDLDDGFRIGDWNVLPLEGRIVRADGEAAGEVRRVRRKAMDVLCALAGGAGQVVERDALLAAVWGATAVTDEPLTATIGELRRLLGDGAERRYIETIPKRGYRLLTPVGAPGADPEDGANPAGAAEPPSAHRSLWLRAAASTIALAAAVLSVYFFVATGDAPVPERSIAVLPFEDLSADGDQAYFADGLAEELISLLTGVEELRVAARTSAFSFRDRDLDTAEVARRLKVANVLTGSVQRMGDQVRITAQLVDAGAGYQLWSETYDRRLDDIFAIQDDIADRVLAELRPRLLGSRLRVRETDIEAYNLYLQARHVGRQNSKEGMSRAVELYRQALAIDPEYVPAWNELAGVYFNMTGFAMMSGEEGYGLAREAAYQALAVDPDYAPAHDRLGWLALHADADLAGAAAHYRRALALAPDNDPVRSNAAMVALVLGRLDDAVARFEASALHDPVSPIAHANLANAYLLARRYADAEQSMRAALTLSPEFAGGRYRLGRMRLAQGDLDGARQAFQAETLPAGQWLGRAFLASAEGSEEDFDAAVAELRAAYGDRAAGNLAQVYAHRGDVDAAFHWLDVEVTANGIGSFTEYRWDPLFDALRGDARWDALLQRAGMSDAATQAIDFPHFSER